MNQDIAVSNALFAASLSWLFGKSWFTWTTSYGNQRCRAVANRSGVARPADKLHPDQTIQMPIHRGFGQIQTALDVSRRGAPDSSHVIQNRTLCGVLGNRATRTVSDCLFGRLMISIWQRVRLPCDILVGFPQEQESNALRQQLADPLDTFGSGQMASCVHKHSWNSRMGIFGQSRLHLREQSVAGSFTQICTSSPCGWVLSSGNRSGAARCSGDISAVWRSESRALVLAGTSSFHTHFSGKRGVSFWRQCDSPNGIRWGRE